MQNPLVHLKLHDIFNRDPHKFEPHPERAWAIIFCVGTVLMISMMAFHFFLYNSLPGRYAITAENDSAKTNETRLNRKGLADAIGVFEAKNLQFQEVLNSASQISDPSLKAVSDGSALKNPGETVPQKSSQDTVNVVPVLE